MKKSIFNLAIATSIMAALAFSGCQSPAEKVEDAKEGVVDAQQDLNEAKQDAMEEQRAEEWRAFRTETEVKIKENEDRIAELRSKMKESGKKMDAVYEGKIEILAQKNLAMRKWMDDHEKANSDWEAFKREFNHDMDAIGEGLADLTKDNQK